MIIFAYPKCSTCQKAIHNLDQNHISYEFRNIKENPPTPEELKKFLKKTDQPLNKFFNTSGLKYRELNLKEKLSSLTEEEKITLLTRDGMLIKRPLLVGDNFILIGYKKETYQQIIEKEGFKNE